MPTRIAVLLKDRSDGTKKVRFIMDALRSGVNGLTSASERIVLPRSCDLVESVIDLLEENQHRAKHDDFGVEILIADFVDAFLTLPLMEQERGYAVVTNNKEWFAYTSVPFGIGTAPLIWGRVSAFLSRLGQSVFRPWEGRIQCYVDDPGVGLAGFERERTRAAALLLLFWGSIGSDIAWKKATLSSRQTWIGAQYVVDRDSMSVHVEVTEDRIIGLKSKVDEALASKGLVFNLRPLAGELSWVAGIAPRVRPFVSSLWASLHDGKRESSNRKTQTRIRPKDAIFLRQVDHALIWIQKFLEGECGPLKRTFSLSERNATPIFHLRGDASTSGMGDILLDAHGNPVEYWADTISDLDLRRFKARRGDSAYMGEFELLRILVSLRIWGPKLRGLTGAFCVQADSKAALGTALKLASPRPLMNAIASEISLTLECFQIQALVGEHFRGSLNVEADALSRLNEGARLPKSLAHVIRASVPVRDDDFYKAWPPHWR